MQTDRNKRRRHLVYEIIKPEVLDGTPGNSNNIDLTLASSEDCTATGVTVTTSAAVAGTSTTNILPVQVSSHAPAEVSLDMRHYDDRSDDILGYNIAFLGSSKVGKTSILQQFLYQNFEEQYVPSTGCEKYRKAVYMNGRIFDMTLRDCPGVVHFPENTVKEWTDCKGFYGLHLSQVFVLVYDTSNEHTFNYVQSMREQIIQCKGSETLIVVVGNKQDLTDPRNVFLKSNMQHTAKKWKCPFVFCSAKYNWHIVKVFNEILKTIGAEVDSKKETSHRNSSRWNIPNCKVS